MKDMQDTSSHSSLNETSESNIELENDDEALVDSVVTENANKALVDSDATENDKDAFVIEETDNESLVETFEVEETDDGSLFGSEVNENDKESLLMVEEIVNKIFNKPLMVEEFHNTPLVESDVEEINESLVESDVEKINESLVESDVEKINESLVESDVEKMNESLVESEVEEFYSAPLVESDVEENDNTPLVEPEVEENDNTPLVESEVEESNESLVVEEINNEIDNESLVVEEINNEIDNESLVLEEINNEIDNESLVVEEINNEIDNEPLVAEEIDNATLSAQETNKIDNESLGTEETNDEWLVTEETINESLVAEEIPPPPSNITFAKRKRPKKPVTRKRKINVKDTTTSQNTTITIPKKPRGVKAKPPVKTDEIKEEAQIEVRDYQRLTRAKTEILKTLLYNCDDPPETSEDSHWMCKKHRICIGENYQAKVPEGVNVLENPETGRYKKIDPQTIPRRNDTLMWSPDVCSEDKVENYLKKITRTKSSYSRANGQQYDIQDVADIEGALHHLMVCDGDVKRALRNGRHCSKFLINPNLQHMTEHDCTLFVHGMFNFYKNFEKVRDTFLPHKSVEQLVEFFYYWKKTPGYDELKMYLAREKNQLAMTQTDFMNNTVDKLGLPYRLNSNGTYSVFHRPQPQKTKNAEQSQSSQKIN